MPESSASSWIVCCKSQPAAHVRLLCLPYAGGAASVYRPWAATLPDRIELWAAQLPGRETRLREPPVLALPHVIQQLAAALQDWTDKPFALFGHSLGALIAFELVRQLRRDGLPLPMHMFVTGSCAPHLLNREPPIYQLPESDFLAELQRRYNGVPQAVLDSPDLMRFFLPILRADLTLLETYHYTHAAPLACPITAGTGLTDPQVQAADLFAWRTHTTAHFAQYAFPGDHFFIQQSRAALLYRITQSLLASRE